MEGKKTKVVIVDDDLAIGKFAQNELDKKGYDTIFLNSFFGIEDAISYHKPDILIFDVEVGHENGIQIAKDLFQNYTYLPPIIFLSSHIDVDCKTEGLLAGGVAYLEKPVSIKLLSAHIDRFTRIKSNEPQQTPHLLTAGNVQLDTTHQTLICQNGNIIDLRPMEYSILKLMINNLNQTISRERLYVAMWGMNQALYRAQTLNNYMRRIRVMLEDSRSGLRLEMSRNIGYQLTNKSD